MGTHFRGSAETVMALNCYIKLMRAAESVTVRAHTGILNKLTLSQLGVLEILLHLGPLCQSQIAAKLLKSGGNITLVVDNLERSGLVVRSRDPEDRRFVTVSLTPEGKALIHNVFPKVAEAIKCELNALTATEQVDLARLCKKLGKRN